MVQHPFGHWPLFQFRNRIHRQQDSLDWRSAHYKAATLSTHRTTQWQNKSRQTSVPWVGFESTMPVFERAKTVHVLDRAAIVIGVISTHYYLRNLYFIVYLCYIEMHVQLSAWLNRKSCFENEVCLIIVTPTAYISQVCIQPRTENYKEQIHSATTTMQTNSSTGVFELFETLDFK
jgi:hypothetical protein